MHQILNPLSLTLVLAFVISAVVATSASAKYDSEVEKTVKHGVQVGTQIWHTAAGTITCEALTTKGIQTGTRVSSEPPIYTAAITKSGTITYSNCTAFGFKAEVKTNGCEYEYLAPSALVAGTKIICPTGKQIEWVAIGFCTMTFGAQTPSGTVSFSNESTGPTRDVKITSSVTGITYGGNCGSGTNGSYTGTTTVRGYSDEALTKQVGIWITS